MPLNHLDGGTAIDEPRAGHRPRVTVGVPVFNGEAFLRETLDSLLGQTLREIEIIVSEIGCSYCSEFLLI